MKLSGVKELVKAFSHSPKSVNKPFNQISMLCQVSSCQKIKYQKKKKKRHQVLRSLNPLGKQRMKLNTMEVEDPFINLKCLFTSELTKLIITIQKHL